MLSRIFETIKTVIIFTLCVTMLVMMLLLMIADQENGEVAYPFEERMIFYENGAEAADGTGMNTSRLQPTAIAMRSPSQTENDKAHTENATLRVVSDGDLLPRVYTSLYPLLRELLGYSAVSTVPNNGASLWKEALGAEELLYIVYPEDLPTALIFAYTFGDGENAENRSLPTYSTYGKELLFCESEAGEMFVLVRASNGAVTRFSVRDDETSATEETSAFDDVPTKNDSTQADSADVNTETGELLLVEDTPTATADDGSTLLHASALSAYIETVGNLAKEAYLACFLCELPDYKEKPIPGEDTPSFPSAEQGSNNAPLDDALKTDTEEERDGVYHLGGTAVGADTALVYHSPRGLPIVSVSSFAGMNVLDGADGEGLYSLLHTVGMRDSAAENHYVDRDGGRVYLDADGRLYISADGSVSYTALQNGGISGSAFLGYSNISGVYSLSESLQISDRLVTVLSERIIPMLCGVAQQSEKIEDSNVLQTPILSVTAAVLEGDVSGVRICYGYSIDGVPLCDEKGELLKAFTVVISGDAVVSFSMMPLIGVAQEQTGYLLPMRVALQAMTYENTPKDDRYGVLQAAYVVHDQPFTQITLTPEWLFSEK